MKTAKKVFTIIFGLFMMFSMVALFFPLFRGNQVTTGNPSVNINTVPVTVTPK